MVKYWAQGVSGNYWLAANWLPASLPQIHDNIVIDQAGSYTVTLSSIATPGINSLSIAQAAGSHITLQVSNTELDIAQNVSNSGTLAAGGFNVGGTIDIGGDLKNSGGISIGGKIEVDGKLTNTGSVLANGDSAHAYFAGPVRNMVDASDPGHVKTGSISESLLSGNFEFGGNVLNAGSIFVGGGFFATGSYRGGGSSMTMDDGLTNKGTVELGTGGKLTVHGDTMNAGSLTIGTLATVALDGLINKGSIIEDGHGVLSFGVGGNPFAAALTTSGDAVNRSDIQILNGSNFTVGGNLNNTGSIEVSGHALSGAGVPLLFVVDSKLDAHGDVHNTGTITASNHGEVLLDGDVVNALGATIEAGQSATVELESAVRNAGDLIADNGTLKIDGALTGSGATMIVDAGIVDLGAAALAHVGFSGAAAGELILRDTADFRGNITGFADTDTIDFKDFLFGQTSVDYKPNAGNTGGRLVLTDQTDPSHHAAIQFVGAYSDSNFASSNDGSGHLLVQHQV